MTPGDKKDWERLAKNADLTNEIFTKYLGDLKTEFLEK
jgi:hypothetical protein